MTKTAHFTFKVLNGTSQMSDEEIALEVLRIETMMNENSKLRFHLVRMKLDSPSEGKIISKTKNKDDAM